jgi:RTX calcium-binding nonapeptide repeat (4 copies)
MKRIGTFLMAAGVLVACVVGIASAGTFGDSNGRTFCDNEVDPLDRFFWGAGEVRGDRNDVTAGFDVEDNGVGVYNEFDPVGGPPDETLTSCEVVDAPWRVFKAKLGTKADTVHFAPHIGFGEGYKSPPASIVARIDLGPGNDRAKGHVGPDKVKAGPGKDDITTGKGRDKVKVAGGGKDTVHCGPDRDRATADAADSLRGCERVKIS